MLSLVVSALVAAPVPQALPTTPAEREAFGASIAGYAAKRIASGVFLGDRSLESILDQEFAPETDGDRMLRSMLDVDVDESARSVTATVFGVSRTAVFRPGLGCALAIGRDADALRAVAKGRRATTTAPRETIAWPLGDAIESTPVAPLEEVLDWAFEEPGEPPLRRTRAVLVVHRGEIIAERYGEGFGPRSRLEGWSMTKTILAALVGIRGVDALEADRDGLFPAWRDEDPRGAITVDQMLCMSAGLEWTESYVDPTGSVVRMLFAEESAARFAIDAELAHEPGRVWSYSSATSNGLSELLRRSFGDGEDALRAYHSFPRAMLFDRAGMASAVLETDPSGTFVLSSYCWATARDWARFGLLLLGDGVIGGRRVLGEEWVATMRTPAPGSNGVYGRQLWLNAGHPDDPERRTYPALPTDLAYAGGFEDQILAIVPSRDLVVLRLGCTKVGSAWSHGEFLARVLAAVPESR